MAEQAKPSGKTRQVSASKRRQLKDLIRPPRALVSKRIWKERCGQGEPRREEEAGA